MSSSEFKGSRLDTKAYEEATRKLRENVSSADFMRRMQEAQNYMATQSARRKPQQEVIYVVGQDHSYFSLIQRKVSEIEPRFELKLISNINLLRGTRHGTHVWLMLKERWSNELRYNFDYYISYTGSRGSIINPLPELYDDDNSTRTFEYFIRKVTRYEFGGQRPEPKTRQCPNKEQHEAYDEYKRLLAENKIGKADLVEKICKIFDITVSDLFVHERCGLVHERSVLFMDENTTEYAKMNSTAWKEFSMGSWNIPPTDIKWKPDIDPIV